jgi:site-specific DNA-cytosine methylase
MTTPAPRPDASANGGLRSLELFSGAGGLALGLSRAGFQPVAVVDWDHVAIQTLKANGTGGRQHTADWPDRGRGANRSGVPQVEHRVAGKRGRAG